MRGEVSQSIYQSLHSNSRSHLTDDFSDRSLVVDWSVTELPQREEFHNVLLLVLLFIFRGWRMPCRNNVTPLTRNKIENEKETPKGFSKKILKRKDDNLMIICFLYLQAI